MLDGAPVIENGRTCLPARDAAQAFGYTLAWGLRPDGVTIRQRREQGLVSAPAALEDNHQAALKEDGL